MKKNFLQSKAFTLVETMVAISILSLAITGPMVIAQKGIMSAVYARDQITAYYLAQEAIEFIRNIRDTNRTTATPWLSQFQAAGCLNTALPATLKCRLNATDIKFNQQSSSAITACPGGVCSVLQFDNTNNLYGYDVGLGGTWRNSPFTRTVEITETVAGVEALISVTISWQTNLFTAPRTFTVKEYMMNF